MWKLFHSLDADEQLRRFFPKEMAEIEPPRLNGHTAELQSDFVIPYLYRHQKQSVMLARGTPYFADLSDPGTGKTLVQIELMLERGAWPVLVICPKSIMESVWQRQIKECGLYPVVLNNGSSSVKAILNEYLSKKNWSYRVFIINYEMTWIVLDELLAVPWQFIVLDESTRIKSPRARRSKAAIKLRDIPKYRSIMTGTPAPNSLLDIFNQFRFLDPRLFGESWYLFRERYMEQKPWDKFNWYPKKDAMERIRKRIALIAVQHKKRECVDLPELVEEIREIEMTPNQRRAYQQMKQQLIVELENETVTAPFVTTKLMKLRQIASGFVYHDEKTFRIEGNKLKELFELIEDIGERKIIVFTHFQESSHYIHTKLLEKNFKAVLFTGKKEEIERFENNAQIFISNAARAG
ncbi:MAG: DEAD/DEAH box helicase, partial [Calditrichaeota bacterium]|nr:DEAD/DEAH box helicase [Calditrichota bacterium]